MTVTASAPGPRIALIHATALSIAPIDNAFERTWPQAERVNLLDDALSRDRARDGRLSAVMIRRFERLADYATDPDCGAGCNGILFTCSAFGPAIEKVQSVLPVPVLKPNQAALEAALDLGPRIGLVATFAATIDSVSEELTALAEVTLSGAALELHTRLAAGAMEALAAGSAEQHDRQIAAAVAELNSLNLDAVVLAQFSMARAQPAAAAASKAPVLTTPDAAVTALKQHFAARL